MNQDRPETRDTEAIFCHRCGRLVHSGRGEYFLVRIEAIADPAPPADGSETLAPEEPTYADLLAELENFTERELMDQVHRRLALTLCNACFRRWIENPVGDADNDAN